MRHIILLMALLFSFNAYSQTSNNQGKAQFINYKTTKTNPIYDYLEPVTKPLSSPSTMTPIADISIQLPVEEVLEFLNPKQVIFQEVIIFDKNGKKIKTVKNNFNEINVKQLRSGKYWVEIWDGKQQRLLSFQK